MGVRTVERTRQQLVTEGFAAVLSRKPSPNRQYRKLDGAQEAESRRIRDSVDADKNASGRQEMLENVINRYLR